MLKEISYMDLMNGNLMHSEVELGLSEMLDKYMGYVQDTLLQKDLLKNMEMISSASSVSSLSSLSSLSSISSLK